MKFASILLLVFALPAAAAVVPSGVPSLNQGKDVGVASAPHTVSVPTSTNDRYVVSCGKGLSPITDGNRYKCFKQTIPTANTDWSIPNGTTVKCEGFYSSVNDTSTMGIIWKWGTAAITNNDQNSDTGATGAVPMCTNGVCYLWNQPNAKPVWHDYPVTFDNASGSTIYPYILLFTSGTPAVTLNFICYTQ